MMRLFDNIKTNSNKPKLRIITLGGTETVTKNMTIYECGDDIIIVDCGVGFPDSEMYGVDVVIPDFSYLLEHKEKVRGLFITHGHEDHIGAVPYLLQELNIPVYTSKLVQGFINVKLKEKKFKDIPNVRFNLLNPETPEVIVGNFKVSAIRINHSVPASMAFAIKTPQGTVLHMADYKIDWTPVLDKPIDLGKIAMYGKEGVLCLMSDCLGSTAEGYTKSESALGETFNELFENAHGRQIFVTTISSNISRMYQIITSAIRHGRKVVFSGRSLDQNSTVARDLGYLQKEDSIYVSEDDISKYRQEDLLYIVAGCYGQQGSSLDRLSRGEHKNIRLEKDALVIFSADPNPPGVMEDVEKVMSNLTLRGAEVVYSAIQENLHVSGHGTRGDLITVASVVRPLYFVPLGGTINKMRAYRNMVKSLGFDEDNVFELLEGESIVFDGGFAQKGDKVSVKPVYLDGNMSDSLSPVVIKDREVLSTDGVFVVILPISKENKTLAARIEIVTRGFIYVKESRALIGKSTDVVNKVLDKYQGKVGDWNEVKFNIEKSVEKFLAKETGRKPLVIVTSVNV